MLDKCIRLSIFSITFIIVLFAISCSDSTAPSVDEEPDKAEKKDSVEFQPYLFFNKDHFETWNLKALVKHDQSGNEYEYQLKLTREGDTSMQSLPGPEFFRFAHIRGYYTLDKDTTRLTYATTREEVRHKRFSVCELDSVRWFKRCETLVIPDSLGVGELVPKRQTLEFIGKRFLVFNDSSGNRIVWGASMVPSLLFPKGYTPVKVDLYTYTVFGNTLDLR